MFKKVFAMTVAVALVTACGGNHARSAYGETSTSTTTTTTKMTGSVDEVLAESAMGMRAMKKAMAAANGAHRSKDNIARNVYRHPVQTLEFFGLRDDMTVVEIYPGGMWYTEILGPVLRDKGQLVVGSHDASIPDQPAYRYRQQKSLEKRLQEEADVFGNVKIGRFKPPEVLDFGKPGSADMVLTFRNIHGWIGGGVAEQSFQAFYEVLKPGGVLGVVQHRGPNSKTADGRMTGYVSEAAVKALAESAGFVFEASSEINANPKDTHDHPEGVWTLPPSLRLGDTNRDKYMAIGESDRMTLRFRKPR